MYDLVISTEGRNLLVSGNCKAKISPLGRDDKKCKTFYELINFRDHKNPHNWLNTAIGSTQWTYLAIVANLSKLFNYLVQSVLPASKEAIIDHCCHGRS